LKKIFPPPFLSIAGLTMICFLIQPTIVNYQEKEIFTNGNLIDVLIKKTSGSCNRIKLKNSTIFFSYKNKAYSRTLHETWCDKITVGEITQMRTDENESKFFFIWESEIKKKTEIGSGTFMILLGLFFIFRGYYDKHKKAKLIDCNLISYILGEKC